MTCRRFWIISTYGWWRVEYFGNFRHMGDDVSNILKILYTSCVVCSSDIHMQFDMSKIFKILYTSCVMCLSDIHVRYLREWFSGLQDFWKYGLLEIMWHYDALFLEIMLRYNVSYLKNLRLLGCGVYFRSGKKEVDLWWSRFWLYLMWKKRGMVFCMMPQSLCAFAILSVKKNDFMVLLSVSASNLECLSKAFPVGATSIYLLDV